jgi:hypothetical protein
MGCARVKNPRSGDISWLSRGGIPSDPNRAMPLCYAAELIGVGGDNERPIRWLIALRVVLRSACHRADSRTFGMAINHV